MHRFVIPLLTASLLSVGCSGEQHASDEIAPIKGSFGLMSITYENDASAGDDLLLTTRAQFVRYTAMDGEHVARLLALPIDPVRDLPQPDKCKVYDVTLDVGSDRRLDREEPGHVELLEAGTLEVETESSKVRLIPRHFPGLLPFISGVVYGEAQSTQERRLGAVKVASGGGEAVGPFVVRGGSPVPPRLARAMPLVARPGRELDLRWQASADADDLTYVQVSYTKSKRDLALRCRPRDDGAFSIPADMLNDALASTSGKLPVEIARVRRTFFNAAGLDRGELRITVRQRAAVPIE